MAQPLEFTPQDTAPGLYSAVPPSPEEPTPHELWLLEHTEIEDTWQTYHDGQERTHQIQAIHLPGRNHRRLYTSPADGNIDPPYTVVPRLGWTESIDTRLVQRMHAHMSELNPEAAISTDATFGIDGTADHLSIWERFHIDQDVMAEADIEMMRLVYGRHPIVVAPTSQSAAVWARVDALNDEVSPESGLNILGRLHYEPCFVPEGTGGMRMIARFFAHMATDYPRELLTRTDPREIPGIVYDELTSSPHLSDLPAIIAQGLALRHGTAVRHLAAQGLKNATVRRGTLDCLRCPEVDSLEGLVIKDVRGKGHSMGMHPRKRATAISHDLRDLGLVTS